MMNAARFSSALGKVNDKYIMEAAAYQRKRKSSRLKWGAFAACFGLVFTVTTITLPGILKGLGGVVPPPQPDVPGPMVSDGLHQPSIEPLQPPGERDITINWDNVAVNESAGKAPDAALLYRDPELYAVDSLDVNGVRDYYGWDLAPAYIPDGLTGGGSGPGGFLCTEKATGRIVEEQAGRSFWSGFWEDGSPKSDDDLYIPTGFTVRASRLGILHCALLPVDGERATDFGGVPVTLSHASLPYGPFDPTQKAPDGLSNMPAGYYDIYVAAFTLDGVAYEIEAQRLELEEVIKITASIINTPYSDHFTVGNSQAPS